MKTFKRTLSLVLAVCVLASMAVIATVSASAVAMTARRTEKVTVNYTDPETSEAVSEEVDYGYGTRPIVNPLYNDSTGGVVAVDDVDEEDQPITVYKYENADETYKPYDADNGNFTGYVVNSDPEINVATRRYYFYMPDSWYNEKNDNYDGNSLESCAAGIYWWGTAYNANDYMGDNAQGWPGFRIVNNLADEGFPNIFYCDVPTTADIIIFNNTVDGGEAPSAPGWGYNAQTININTKYTKDLDDTYGFYKGMTEENPMTFDNMIYVVNPADTETNDYGGALTTKGDWFYYYGDGTYGTSPEKGEVAFSNGEFPSNLDISSTGTTLYANEQNTITVKTTADPSELTVESADAKAVSVGKVSAYSKDGEKWKSQVKITGLKEADDVIVTFTQTGSDGSQAIRTALMSVSYIRPKASAAKKTVNVGKTVKPFTVKYGVSVTYKSSNTKVATVDKNGVVKGVAGGTAKVTVTAKAGRYPATATAVITVKKLANTMTAKAKNISASAKAKKTFAASKYATVKKAVGKVTYKKASGDKKITVAKNGKMTVNKGLKKGKTFTVKVKVTAAGNAKYAASTKTIAVKVKVK